MKKNPQAKPLKMVRETIEHQREIQLKAGADRRSADERVSQAEREIERLTAMLPEDGQ